MNIKVVAVLERHMQEVLFEFRTSAVFQIFQEYYQSWSLEVRRAIGWSPVRRSDQFKELARLFLDATFNLIHNQKE